MATITHDELTAQTLLASLPKAKAEALRLHAMRTNTPVLSLIIEALTEKSERIIEARRTAQTTSLVSA